MKESKALPGELTIFTVGEWHPRLLAWLDDGADSPLAVDAAPLAEVDGAGVQLLIALRRSLHERGRSLALSGATPVLQAACAQLGAQALLEAGPQPPVQRTHP